MKNNLFLISLLLCSIAITSIKLENKSKHNEVYYEEEICEEEPYIYQEPGLEDDGCYEQGFIKVIHEVKERPVMVPQYVQPQIQYIPQPIYIPIRTASHHKKKQPVIILNNGDGGCSVVDPRNTNSTLLSNLTDFGNVNIIGQGNEMELPISAPIEESISAPIEQPISVPIEEPISAPIELPMTQPMIEQVEQPTQSEEIMEESTQIDEWTTEAEDGVEEAGFLDQ